MRLFAAEGSGAPQLYTLDGKFEYVPLFFFQLLEEDSAAVGRAVAQLGSALLPGGDIEMREALRGFSRRGQTCEDLVMSFAQAHGVLDLEPVFAPMQGSSGIDAATGSVKQNLAPPSGGSSTQMRCPCASTNVLAMVSPSPAPASSSRRARSPKISSRRSRLTPGPWAVTETSMVVASVLFARIVIEVSFGRCVQ